MGSMTTLTRADINPEWVKVTEAKYGRLSNVSCHNDKVFVDVVLNDFSGQGEDSYVEMKRIEVPIEEITQ